MQLTKTFSWLPLVHKKVIKEREGHQCDCKENCLIVEPMWAFSPVVEQEEDVRDADDDLQPAPVRDEVGQQREDEDAPAEEHLEQNTDRPPVLHSNYLCD